MSYNLEDLEREAGKQREYQKKRLRDHYRLAKELGFSASEAQILSLKPEALIRKLAEERLANA